MIKFVLYEKRYMGFSNKHGIYTNLIYKYKVVDTGLTERCSADKGGIMGSNKDGQGEAAPGLSLQEWLEASEMTYYAFSRLVPCAVAYPRKIALGLARPSYELACRIEQVTDGAVPRTRWYPPGTQEHDNDDNNSIEDMS